MKTISVYSLGNPGTFDLIPGDDMYWTERLSYEFSKMLYDMQTQGFDVRQEEATDYDTLESDLDTFSDSFATWAESAFEASTDGLPIPSPPSVPALPGGPLGGMLISIFLRIIIKLLVRWIEKMLIPDTEGSEIAQILKKGLIDQNASGEDYSILWNLARQAIHIILTKESIINDVELRDYPESF